MRPLFVLLFCSLLAAPAAAQELKLSDADTLESMLVAHKGKRVTLKVRGQELTGVLRAANGKLVVLGALTGREFFDAAIPLEAVDALIVRTK